MNSSRDVGEGVWGKLVGLGIGPLFPLCFGFLILFSINEHIFLSMVIYND